MHLLRQVCGCQITPKRSVKTQLFIERAAFDEPLQCSYACSKQVLRKAQIAEVTVARHNASNNFKTLS